MTYIDKMRARAEALAAREKVRILAIESSCDESAAAVVENGRTIVSSAVYSQVDLHALYGGVVPEIASRSHIEKVDLMVQKALDEAGETFDSIDCLAVTYGPGLVGSLLTGVTCAKAIAFAADKPLIPVHHIEGHICANYLTHPDLEPPYLCLAVSGGHSHIYLVRDHASLELLGCTGDDAAGEAFDKAARVLGLPYPGGPRLDAAAEGGDPDALKLPVPHTPGAYDFSFSGLKTAFINAVHRAEMKGETIPTADYAASFRRAVVDTLVDKTMAAAKASRVRTVAIAGGVAANRLLRQRMTDACDSAGLRFCMPDVSLCGDNAAMIGSAAYYRLKRGIVADLMLNAVPALQI